MNNRILLAALLAVFIGLSACGEDKSSENRIQSFKTGNVEWVVGESTITATVKKEASTKVLTPQITLVDSKATVSPASGVQQDFESPITYTVTAEDGSTKTYIATATWE